jgi:hypothetical protein
VPYAVSKNADIRLSVSVVVARRKLVGPANWIPLADGVIITEGMYVIDANEFTGRVTLAGASGAALNVYVDANPSP